MTVPITRTAAEAPRLTGPRPTHYIAFDGSLQPFTVCHRVSFGVAGVRHFTRVDSMEACRKAMQVHAILGNRPVLHYTGSMSIETADRMYPAGPRPMADES